MKFLVFACIIAVSLAAPVAKPDDDDNDNVAVESGQVVTSVVGAPSVVDTQIFSGAPVFQQNAIAYSVPVSINQGAQVYTGAVPYSVGALGVYKAKKNDGDDDDDDDDVKFVKSGYYASAYAPAGVNVAVAPTVSAYSAGQAVATPAITSYNYQQAVAAPSVGSYSVSNAVATPAVASYAVASPAVATPVQYKVQSVVPAVAAVRHEAVVQEVKPVSVAVPSAITYQAAHTVQLPPKEINVPVQHQTVQIPVEQRVHYGTENYVAGTSTKVYKPQITAPAIAAPNVFVAKTRHAAPEVTVHHSEVTVEQKSPHYVAAPYDAGVIVEQAAPHINQVDVPTPVEVLQPVNVPTPYAVPVAHPVKVKSSVKPVVNVDLHSVQTENVVTPIEYTAHHHVATAPVAVQAAPAVGVAANVVPTAVTYGAAAPSAYAVQGVATQGVATGGASGFGVLTQGVAPYGVVSQGSQGVVTGGHAVGYSAVPVAQNVIYGSSPAIVQGAGVPSVSFTGQKFNQGEVKFVTVGETSANIVPQVTTYSGSSHQSTPGSKVSSGSQVYFDTSVNLDD